MYGQLFINEWMAVNNTTVADNAGEYDDWIEIYNGGNIPIDLAGYYLSDDISDPLQWQIPNSNSTLTTIPPNGFLLLWADDDTDQGENHLSFKLGASGEPIFLTAPDGVSIVDQVLFGPQNSDVSYGRVMDGSAAFQFFLSATPAASNNINTAVATYNAIFDIPVLEGSDDAEEPVGQSYTIIGENTLNIVNDWSGDQTVGIRFQQIPFPTGAMINRAYIQFTTAFAFASVGPSDLTIQSELANNSSTFSESANNVTNRVLGTETVNWQPEEWTLLNEAALRERTPDLSALVQEVVSQSGWSEGNAVSFIFSGTGKRVPWSADNPNPDYVPRLFIEGELPTPTTLMDGLLINEIAARGTTYADEFEECDDWIELYNNSTTTASIGGLFLTDDLDNLTKWQIASPTEIPPGGFQTIWIDKDTEQGGLHANFKLSGSGDQIALVQWIDNEFVVLDEVDFGEIPFQSSYGRLTDGGNDWTVFGQITPNASNENALPWLESPTIDLQTGAYTGTQTVTVTHPNSMVSIHYTIDGSEPTINSTIYNSPITINGNTSLKAKAIANGFVESRSATASYLIDENITIPALYINTDPANFFDDSTGIYVQGTNGIPGFCISYPANWNQDWEVPVNLSMIKPNGDLAFNVNAGAKIGGGCSRQYGLKSLNIYTRETKYGDEKIDYPLFAGRNHQNYQRIKLRNSGQDYLRTGFRDGLLHSLLWGKVDLELQAFQPSVLYINGEFWGVQNIRERYTDEFFETNLDFKKDEIDVIRNPGLDWEEVKQGDNNDYNELFSFFESNDFSTEANYLEAESMIDLNSFTNYWASMIYNANGDWPANNIMVWKEKVVGGKWRYAVMDQDNSSNTGFNNQNDTDYNTLAQVTDENSLNWPNHKNSTLTFRKLLENDKFRNEYIQRTCSFIHLIYNEERTHHMIDSIQNMIDPYMEQHINKWAADNSGGGTYLNWQGWVNEFRDFFTGRPGFMRTFINDEFNLNGTYQLQLNYDEDTGGRVRINSNLMETPYNYSGLYFKDIPVVVTAVPKPNYVFAYWLETGETDPTINFVSNEDAMLTPIFEISLSVNIGSDTSICSGSTLMLDAEIVGCDCDYLWSNGATTPLLELTINTNTIYSVTVTDAGGTPNTDEISVSVYPSPTTQLVTSSVLCPNGVDGSIDLQVTGGAGGFTYLWNTGANQQDISGLSAGVYEVTITDQNGCETIVENVLVEEPLDFDLDIETVSTSCPESSDGAISLSVSGATAPYSYLWSNNTTTADQNNIAPENYSVTITDAAACTIISIATVVAPGPIDASITLDLPEPGQSNGTIFVDPYGGTGPYTISWFNGETGTILSDLPFGIYSLVITDANGCTEEKIIDFFPVGWTEPKELLRFELMPNPAVNICNVQLEFSKQEMIGIKIYSATGQLLTTQQYEGETLTVVLDVSEFSTGVYFVELVLETGRAYRRLVVR